jgi:hypothetical protein
VVWYLFLWRISVDSQANLIFEQCTDRKKKIFLGRICA